MTVARRLRRLRESRQWSVHDLAERSGVSVASILYLERTDLTDPTLAALNRISRALDVPLRLLIDDPVYGGAEAATQHLPPDLLQFIADPANLPYLQLARQLAEGSVAGDAHRNSLAEAAAVLEAVAAAQEEATAARPGTRIVNFGQRHGQPSSRNQADKSGHQPAQGGR